MDKKISNILLFAMLTMIFVVACKTKTSAPSAMMEAPKKTTPALPEVKPGVGIDLDLMDLDSSPKDDFFRYVNGTWFDNTEIPNDRTVWGSFHELRQRTDKDALEILSTAANDPNLNPTSDQAKAVYLFGSIMNMEQRNAQGIDPVKPYLAKIDKVTDVASLQNYLIEMEPLGGGGFFGFGVGSDAKDSNKNSAYLGTGALGLPDRDYYTEDDDDSKDKREKYVAHIARMLQYIGDSEEQAMTNAKNILAFETRLAKHRLTKVDRRNPELTYNPTSMKELQNMAPAIDWKNYIQGVSNREIETIIVSQPNYIKAVSDILLEKNVGDWKNYLRWTAFNEAVNLLSEELETANWEFYSKTLRGAKEQRPRDENALQTLNWTIGEALGQLYVDKKFPPEAKKTAEDMIKNIQKAYEKRINDLAWMSEETKAKAITKLYSMTIKIAYPDKWKDYSALNVTKDASYFENMLNLSKWRYKKNIAELDKPVDKTKWYMPPQMVNAYYNPSYNEIVFPAAILQPPFYDYKADAAINYGGIGAVIGHEISHGFDDQGAKFDAEGNLNNWWTETDLEEFGKLGDKLADQFSKIEVLPDVFINGKFTLGENIGDLGGVNSAYDGLQIYLAENGNPGDIDGYSPEQRFFISWGTIWRTKMRDEALVNRIKTDPHSPGMYRAFVPLQNVDAFYNAFDIKAGDKMFLASDERVLIW